MDTGFALLLFAALVLSGLLSWLQHRAYSAATRRMMEQFHGRRDAILVSGRGKGLLRGAVVILVVDARDKRVVAAEAMVGTSVLARFRERPELLGPISSAADRASEKRLAQAIQSALEQYKTTAARGARAASS